MVYQWGTATNPVAYGYDPATGELTTLKTYQNAMGDWAGPTQPVSATWDSAARSSTTTWGYDSASGALVSKTDAAKQAVKYWYNSTGEVAKRTWARGSVTNYAYDPVGRVKAVTYSDATPPVTLKYTRAGEITEQTDATGRHVYTRNSTGLNVTDNVAAGTGEWQGLSFGRIRSTINSVDTLRSSAFFIQVSGTPLYGTSRLQYLGGLFKSVTGLGIVTTYGYNTVGLNSGFTAAADSATSGGYPVLSQNVKNDMVRAIAYESNPGFYNRLKSIKYGTATSLGKAGWTYSYDNAWRRKSINPDNTELTGWSYAYTNEGAVLSADRMKAGGNLINQHWEYQYDAIGNRTKVTKGALGTVPDADQHSTIYALATEANRDGTQYTGVSNPPLADISGKISSTATSANKAASVTMAAGAPASGTTNPTPVTPISTTASSTLGETDTYYREFNLVSAGLGAQARWVQMKVETGSTTPHPNRDGWFFHRGTSETFLYDQEGNLLSDARWTYTWDAENQLIAMEEKEIPGLYGVVAPSRQKLEFVYDGDGRRAAKRVYCLSGSNWKLQNYLVFLYDGWNLVAELDALRNRSVLRRFVWGPDLSGSMGGAGGVSGLLLVEHTGDSIRYQIQNDGNGNVMGLMALDGSKASQLVGRFDYDAFGNRVTNTLPTGQEACPIGFSSKYEDKETGLLYYGQRYYVASSGRWLNKDPIQESGGLNTYEFILNDAINGWDYLGKDLGTLPIFKLAAPTIENHPDEGDEQARSAIKGHLLGSSDINREFGPDSAWTQDMKKHVHMDTIRSSVKNDIKNYCAGDTSTLNKAQYLPFSLNQQSVMTNAKIYLRDMFSGIGLGSTVHSTGSIDFTYTITSVDCCAMSAEIKIDGSDTLALGSGTRIPKTKIAAPDFARALGAFTPSIIGGMPLPYQVPSNAFNGDPHKDDVTEPNKPFNNIHLHWYWTESVQSELP